MCLLLLLSCLTITAAAVWALWGALLRPARPRAMVLLAVAALALAPAATAWIFAMLLRVVPGQQVWVYAIGALLLPGLLLVVSAWRWKPWRVTVGGEEASCVRRPWMATALVAIGAALLVAVMGVTPLYDNDALEYATAARLISERASLKVYPAVDSSSTGGFYGPWTHPAGYPSLLAFATMLQGDKVDLVALMRIAPLYASLALLVLVAVCARGARGTLAATVLLGTPIYLISTINMWADPARVSAGAASVVVAFVVLSGSGVAAWRAVLAVGIALGLTFFMHSIGIVVLGMVGALILIWGEGFWARRLLVAAGAAAVALIAVAPDVVTNLRNFGAVVADAPPVWKVPGLGYLDWMLMARDLYSPEGKLVNGLLMGFSQTYYYGASYVLALAGAFLALRRVRRVGLTAFRQDPRAQFVAASEDSRWLLVCGAVILFWVGGAVATTLAGIFEFIKNVRYPYTIQPFVALLAGIGIGEVLEGAWGEPPRGRALKRLLQRAAVLAIALWMLMPLARYANYTRAVFGLPGGWLTLSDVERLETVRLDNVHWVKAVDRRMAAGECVLLFRQADYAFYGRGCYFNYLDSRLIPLYLAQSREEIRAILATHRIRWVFLPSYNLPEYYNSLLEAFFSDPVEATLEWDLDHARIYRIPPVAAAAGFERTTTLRITPERPLRDQQGEARMAMSQSRGLAFMNELVSEPSSVDQRSPVDPNRTVPFSAWCGVPVSTPILHGFEVAVSGTGYLDMVAQTGTMYFDSQDAVGLRWQRMWDGAIRGPRTIRGQFLVEPGQCLPLELRFSLRGAGHVAIERGEVFEFRGWSPPAGAFQRQAAMVREWTAMAEGRFQRSWRWGRSDDGEYFTDAHPHPGVPTTLLAPISQPVAEPAPGFRSVPARVTIEISGRGRVQILASVHPARHAAVPGKAPSRLSRLLKLVKAAAPAPSARGTLDGLRRVVETLWDGALPAPRSGDEVGEVPLRSGHVQEIRRRVLFDGALGATPAVYHFLLSVEPGDRIQIAFLIPPHRRNEPGASVRIRHMAVVAGPESRARLLFDSAAW